MSQVIPPDLIFFAVQDQSTNHNKWYYARRGVVDFGQRLKLSMDLLIFSMVNTFSSIIFGLQLRQDY